MLHENNRYKTIMERSGKYEAKHVTRGFYFQPDHGDTVCPNCLSKLEKKGLVSDGIDHYINPAVFEKPKYEWFPDDPDANHDTLPHCDAACFKGFSGCGRILYGWFTDYGASDELEYLEEEGFNIRNHHDCYIWMLLDNAFVEGSEEHNRLLDLAGIAYERAVAT